MKKVIILLTLILVFTVQIIQAEEDPKPSKKDKRITSIVYNPNDVFNVYARDGFVTIIMFDKDEIITSAGTGFSGGWTISQRANVLRIIPKAYTTTLAKDKDTGETVAKKMVVVPNAKAWKTNLFVTTNKRTYMFNLFLSNKKAQYKITFKYPHERAKERAAKKNQEKVQAQQEMAIVEEKNIQRDLDHSRVPRNWNFDMSANANSNDIKPSFVYDDGVFTYIGFTPSKTMPVAFLREGESEAMLNTSVKEIRRHNSSFSVLVVHRLIKQIMLRSGDKLVAVRNNAYESNPMPMTQDTSNSSIEREIIK